jgi:spore maturation protein CgeB
MVFPQYAWLAMNTTPTAENWRHLHDAMRPAGSWRSDKPRTLVIGSAMFADTMEWHVLDALRHLGAPSAFVDMRVLVPNWPLADRILRKGAEAVLRDPDRLRERKLVEIVRRFRPDLILVILGNQLSPQTVTRLRRLTTAPIVCWCQDQMTTMGRQYIIGAGYDIVFVKDRYLQELFSRMIRVTSFEYLPEACNPRVHRSIHLSEADRALYGCDVTLFGNMYYYRQEILTALNDFDVRLWGNRPRWLLVRGHAMHMNREVRGDEKARAVGAARIALNTLHYGEVRGINCRAFELAACGGFQVMSASPVLAEHFAPGQELETFSTIDELVDKVRHFLGHPDDARTIAEAGQRRAHRDHTYENRLTTIFASALGAPANPLTGGSVQSESRESPVFGGRDATAPTINTTPG